jgi:cytochrome c553
MMLADLEIDGEQRKVLMQAPKNGFFYVLDRATGELISAERDNVLSGGRLLTFKLGGDAALPAPDVTFLEIPEPPEMATTPAQIAHGETLFHTYCAVCHGPGAVSSGGGTADLRYSSAAVHASWDAIVLDGAFTGQGMVGFAHALSADDSRALQAYVIDQAKSSIALCNSEYRKNYPEVLETACVRPQ